MRRETLQHILSGELALRLERACWRLAGPDRVRYLNGQVTQDIKKLPAGHAAYAAACTAKGRMQGDLTVAAGADALWIDAPVENGQALGARLEKYLIADDAVLEDISSQWQVLHVVGAEPPHASSDAMLFSSERFGLPGWDLWLPRSASSSLPVASPEDLEIFRIRQGLPRWGVDMDETTLPQEMGFDTRSPVAISYTKGCYTGQETIARIKSIGHVNKLLCRVACETLWRGGLPAGCGAGGQPAGTLTSACENPEQPGTSIGLAVLRQKDTEAGTVLEAGGAAWRVTS
jgi:folate-binding protein YgfZ